MRRGVAATLVIQMLVVMVTLWPIVMLPDCDSDGHGNPVTAKQVIVLMYLSDNGNIHITLLWWQ